MAIPALDPDSPVPLYHQIAELLRDQLAAGELAPGDVLEPMRAASKRLGVNLHTVRHAYAALAREGLVEMQGARGTRVTSRARAAQAGSRSRAESLHPAGTAAFLRRVVDEAARHHGLIPEELAAAIQAVEPSVRRPAVAVVECSALQCASHSAELEARFVIDAEAFPLDRDGTPCADTVVATWFHYNDVRRRWPQLLATIEFVTIRPDVSFAEGLGSQRELLVVETDVPTAEAICGDLEAALPEAGLRFRPVATERPDDVLADDADHRAVVFPPRVWAQLEDCTREHHRSVELRYAFDVDELAALGARHRWSPRHHRSTS